MHFCHRQTDRRTDSQTQGYGIYRASIYTVVSRGKKKQYRFYYRRCTHVTISRTLLIFPSLSLGFYIDRIYILDYVWCPPMNLRQTVNRVARNSKLKLKHWLAAITVSPTDVNSLRKCIV